jgi:hypothetical protein
VIENPACPDDLRDELFATGQSLTPRNLIRSRFAKPQHVDAATVSEDLGLRTYVARREDVSPENQALLSIDPSVDVRTALAYNPNVTLKTVGVLGADEDAEVRRVVHDTQRRNNLPY